MSEWKYSTIDQSCEILDIYRIPLNEEVRSTKHGVIPYYGANGVQGHIDEYLFDEPLILIAEDGGYFDEYETRPIAYRVYGKSWVNNHAHILRTKPGFGQDYIFYSLVHKNILPYIKGGTRAKLNQNELKQIQIYHPESLDEQLKVSQVLNKVDDLIEKTEAAIDKYHAIKAGMMQDLFTRGIDTQTCKLRPTIEEAPELYKESELGWIPKEWDVTDFDDVIKEYFDFRGKTPLKLGMNWGGGSIKAISANNIEPGFINFNKEHYLASEDLYRAWMNHGDCSKGDVVMTSEAPLGVVAQIPDNNKYILSQRVFLFKVKPSSITNDYLYYLMNTDRFQNDLQRQSSGSTVTGIQQARLARIRMQLTRSLEEQLHISKILKSIDLGISDNKEMLSKYKNLKHGLMADLLTGKVRVNLNDNKVEKG